MLRQATARYLIPFLNNHINEMKDTLSGASSWKR